LKAWILVVDGGIRVEWTSTFAFASRCSSFASCTNKWTGQNRFKRYTGTRSGRERSAFFELEILEVVS